MKHWKNKLSSFLAHYPDYSINEILSEIIDIKIKKLFSNEPVFHIKIDPETLLKKK